MFFDMQYDSPINGIFALPDFPFADLPRQEPITDVIEAQGGDNSTFVAGGSTE